MAKVRTSTAKQPRAWQRMISGRRLDLLDPSPVDVEIDDIAHGLARVARWNGQTLGDHAFSVAEHSVVVERIVGELYPDMEPKWRMAALLHDSSEYVIGDMISPFKAALGVDYRIFEDKLETAVHVRFGHDESIDFFGRPPASLHVDINPAPPKVAQKHFVARFNELLADMDAVRAKTKKPRRR